MDLPSLKNAMRLGIPAIVVLAGTVLGPNPLRAQVTQPSAEIRDTVVFELQAVTVDVTRARQQLSRVPQAVTLIGPREIQLAQRRATLDEALRGIPGVFVVNRHNVTVGEGIRLNIRAPMARLGTRGLQLLQDGIPLTMADGTTLPNNLDLGSAGLVEVVRGPSSVQYGNSAGGVVSVETELPSDRPFVVHPELQFGTHGYNRQQIRAEGTAGALGYVANFNRLEMAGFRPNSASEIRRMNMVARSELSDGTLLRGVFNLFDMPFGENPSTMALEDARDAPFTTRQAAIDGGWGKSVRQGQGGLTLDHSLGGGHEVRVLGWGMWRDNWNPIPGRIIGLSRTGGGLRSEYRGGRGIASVPIEWVAGVDYAYQRDDRREHGNLGIAEGGGRAVEGDLRLEQVETVRSVGPFAQFTVTPSPAWSLSAGVRYDAYRFVADDRFLADGDQSGTRNLDAASPMVGITYAPHPLFNVYANLATAYQTPTTVELSNRPDDLGGFNEELEPEYLRSIELGVRGALRPVRLRYELAAYLSTVENALLRYESPGEMIFFRNAGRSSRDGLELALEWEPVRALVARLAYTYQDFRFKRYTSGGQDFSGNREPGAPPHMLFAGVRHTAPFGLSSVVDVRWMDAYPVNDANTAENWAFTVVDARFALDGLVGSARIRPFLGIDNLFDERHNPSVTLNAFGNRFYEPGPGRTFYLGLAMGAGL